MIDLLIGKIIGLAVFLLGLRLFVVVLGMQPDVAWLPALCFAWIINLLFRRNEPPPSTR